MTAADDVIVSRLPGPPLSRRAWYWNVWWDEGNGMGQGVSGWARTKWGAKRAARRENAS